MTHLPEHLGICCLFLYLLSTASGYQGCLFTFCEEKTHKQLKSKRTFPSHPATVSVCSDPSKDQDGGYKRETVYRNTELYPQLPWPVRELQHGAGGQVPGVFFRHTRQHYGERGSAARQIESFQNQCQRRHMGHDCGARERQ